MTEFIKDHGGMFGLLGLVVAILALLYPLRRDRITDTAKELCDPEFREDILGKRNETIGTAYFIALGWLIAKADRFYGKGLFTVQAFEVCLLLAIFYPLTGALIAWVLFNTIYQGGLILFTPISDTLDRSLIAAVLIAGLTLYAYGLSQLLSIAAFHDKVYASLKKIYGIVICAPSRHS